MFAAFFRLRKIFSRTALLTYLVLIYHVQKQIWSKESCKEMNHFRSQEKKEVACKDIAKRNLNSRLKWSANSMECWIFAEFLFYLQDNFASNALSVTQDSKPLLACFYSSSNPMSYKYVHAFERTVSMYAEKREDGVSLRFGLVDLAVTENTKSKIYDI